MGKAALMLVIITLFGWTLQYANRTQTFLEQEDEQAFYGEQVLAREKALSGFNVVVGNTEDDFENYRIDLESTTHRDGDFTISAVDLGNNTVQVTATGRVGRAEYTIVGDMVGGGLAKLATLNIDGPVSKAQGRGMSYMINGVDTDYEDEAGVSSGGGPNAFGVYSVTNQAHQKMVEGLDESRVLGGPEGAGGSFVSGENEALMQDAFDGDAPNFEDMANKIEKICNPTPPEKSPCIRFEGDQTFAGNDVFGQDKPAIVYVDGNLTFRGSVDGHGILYIKGDFKTEVGEPRWEGMVFANTAGGTHELRGQPRIDGTIILRSTTEDAMSLLVRGEPTFNFSSQGVEMVSIQLGMPYDKFVSGGGGIELTNVRQSAGGDDAEGIF